MRTAVLRRLAALLGVLCLSPSVGAEPAWWEDAVFYQIFVRSFADAGEGPLAGDGVGDFRGLIERLDYLNDGDPDTTDDLGITALWLLPVSPSPSYHGYDITDYRGINPDYGTMEDFRAFLEACRARGVRVVIDLVINHCSSRHAWFLEAASDPDSPKRDWFVWSEEHPGWRGPWNQPVWHGRVRERAGAYYYGCFSPNMPDLNLENPAVTAELKDIARFWIEEVGVDGFRLDAIKHLIEDGPIQENTQATIAWLEDFNAFCRSLNPEFLTVGEVWSSTEQVARYIPDAVDTAFEFDLGYAIIHALNTGEADGLADRLRAVLAAYDTPVATFLTNHDQARVMTQLGGHPGKARAAATLLLTLPGVPFIYYGEEIGHTGAKPDPNIRTPMQWTGDASGFTTGTPWRAPQPDAGTVHVAAQTDDPDSLLSHYRGLIRQRLGSDALRRGGTVLLEAPPGVIAYERVGPGGERLVVSVNLTDRATDGFQAGLSDDRSVRIGPLAPYGHRIAALEGGSQGMDD